MTQILVFALMLSVLPGGGHGSEPGPAALVANGVAELPLSVGNHDGSQWAWCLDATPDNVLEYRWVIGIAAGESQYEVGFSLFKFPGSHEAHGSLDDLLKAGQLNVWKVTPDGGAAVVPGATVTASVRDSLVILRLADSDLVRTLFASRPSRVRVKSRTPESSETTKEMEVQYQDARPAVDDGRGASIGAATATPAEGPPSPTDVRLASARSLIEATGGNRMATQIMQTLLTSIKKTHPDVPAAFWAQLEAEIKPDEFVELAIPIYAKHLTVEEMQQLQAFYESPLGQRLLQALPAIMQESMETGREWGREVGARIQKRLRDCGYSGKIAD